MNKLEQASAYFKENQGYTRLFKGIKSKYISLGQIKGNVIISNPTEIEKQAISGLMKKDYSKNKTISINLKKMQQMLDESRFSGVDLKDILNQYFKEEISTKKENALKYEIDLKNFFESILEKNRNTYVYKYLEEIIDCKNEIYENLKMYYNREKDILQKELINACKGINNLPKQKTRIPVFASDITSNPHGFDKKSLCGKIFIMLLCYINDVQRPKNSEELSELLFNNNLLIDDVSNMVLCKNITAFTKVEMIEKAEEHEGWKGFNQYTEPIFLTLYNLSNIDTVKVGKGYKNVVVTENPAVFMAVKEKCKFTDFPLVCTYGQVRLSGIILLNLLIESGLKIYYSGDLDPEGIQIADKLKTRFKDNIEFLGFDVNTYYQNMSDIKLNDTRLSKLDGIKSLELQELCKKIKENRKVAYEEKNIEGIIEFIENFVFLCQ